MPQFSTLYSRLLTQELGDEDSTVLFTDARRKAAVNDGLREFADLTECYVKQSTIAVTGGTAEYDLLSTTVIASGDFVRLARQSPEFHYTDASSNLTQLAGDDFIRRDIEWLDRYEPSWRESSVTSSVMQTPVAYYLRPDGASLYFGMVPTPCTGSSATAKVLLPYVAYPAALTSDTNEPFGGRADLRPYHQAAVHYAAHQLEKLRRDDQAADRQLQKFTGLVQKFLSAMRPKGGTHLTTARRYWRRGVTTLLEKDPRT